MQSSTKKVCLVVPCYNEEDRLDRDAFKNADKNIYFIFVNDGSKDKTTDVIKAMKSSNIDLLDLSENVGKAEAVRQGMLYFDKSAAHNECEWVGFWDADLATPLSEVPLFLKYLDLYGDADSIWGSRVLRLGGKIERSRKRHYLGRFFATVVSVMFKVGSYDTQCGAKLFKRSLIETIFGRPFISKWIFDVEILLALKKHRIIEYPLTRWKDIDGSKINLTKAAFKVLRDLFNIKKRYSTFID